jgi:hypothetical protein
VASRIASPFSVGQVFEISFPTFTPRITVHSQRELTVEIVAGENRGFAETVEYVAVTVRDGLVMLSWREHSSPRRSSAMTGRIAVKVTN